MCFQAPNVGGVIPNGSGIYSKWVRDFLPNGSENIPNGWDFHSKCHPFSFQMFSISFRLEQHLSIRKGSFFFCKQKSVGLIIMILTHTQTPGFRVIILDFFPAPRTVVLLHLLLSLTVVPGHVNRPPQRFRTEELHRPGIFTKKRLNP